MEQQFISPGGAAIGWIGLGVMGAPMASRLQDAGYRLIVNNRTKEKAAPLLSKGAEWADTPEAVARLADVIITMVGYPNDVEEVYFSDEGILKGTSRNKLLIDMTTTDPALSARISSRALEFGAWALDAPVSGGDVGARTGALSIMVGGEKQAVDMAQPLFQILGKNIVRQGGAGAGQHAKMCNQIVIAGSMIGVCESLLYAYKAGLDPETLLSSISRGAAGCWTLDNLAPRIINKNFEPGFFVDHFVKDMGIALEEAKRMRIVLPGLALVHQLYVATQAAGFGKKGTHALTLTLKKLANME